MTEHEDSDAGASEELRLEYMPMAQVVEAARNPKGHRLDVIEGSMGRFGYTQPLMIDEASQRLVAGHGRLRVLVDLKAAGKRAPKRVKVAGGEWLVPVFRGVSFADEREAQAYLLADNQT